MNYFSHYYFFQTEDKYITIGSVLPDLARFSEGKKKLYIPENSEIILNKIQKGCDLHYVADHYFHQSTYFKDAEVFVKDLFQKNKIQDSNVRNWFLIHVLIELLLDRILIRKHPEILNKYYDDFNAVDIKYILMYLEKCERKGLEKFADFFQKFTSSRFMFSYISDEGFLASINGLLQKAKQSKLPEDYERKLKNIFPVIEVFLKENLPKLEEDCSAIPT